MNRFTCPFDPAHVVEGRRLQAHIIKCKRNLPVNHDFVQCHCWGLHYVRKSQVDSHLANCEHRLEKQVFKTKWESESAKFFPPKLLPVEDCRPSTADMLDSWESMSGPVFIPENMIAGAIHMTIPQGLSKSRRKEFRDKELERLRELKERQGDIVTERKRVDDHIVLQTRKPEVLVKHPVRIAAKFSISLDQDEDLPEQSIDAHLSAFQLEGVARNRTGGRGRDHVHDVKDPQQQAGAILDEREPRFIYSSKYVQYRSTEIHFVNIN